MARHRARSPATRGASSLTGDSVSYLDQTLTTGEVVLYRTRLHWTALFWTFVIAVSFGAGAIALFVAAALPALRERAGLFMILGAACAVIAAGAAITGMVRQSSTEMAVTNRRVLMKSGILGRRTVELMLSKVESIGVDQGIFGRMAGYGRVVVRGTGGTHELFDRIARPLEFRRQVQEQIDKLQPGPMS